MRRLPTACGWLALLWLSLIATLAPTAAWASVSDPSSRAADEIHVSQLPPEGRATLALIKRGGPFVYARDGIVFHNREGRLPARPRGYYREYTVPTLGLAHRGARRIVAGRDGDYWYTDDHYRTFKRIRE
ncbi:MAG: ribonuclease domain-containing protein [Thiobacillaceae bacterium]